MRLIASLASLVALSSCTTGPERIDAALLPDGGSDTGVADSGPRVDTGPPVDSGPRIDDVLIYAHSRDTLFTFSAYTNTVTEVGLFRLPSGEAAPYMLDLAVDSVGAVFTSSRQELFSVDPVTATATPIGDFGLGGAELNALSFLTPTESPDGTETLVGATNAGTYYEVDRTDASTRVLGSYPDGWSSSGDIVSVAGLGTFATLRRMDYPGDVLARIIFARDGTSTVSVVGAIRSPTEDFRSIYGLGYWGRDMFGFSSSGQLIRIDRMTGAAEVVTTSTGSSQFWGAGVTTQVPVLI